MKKPSRRLRSIRSAQLVTVVAGGGLMGLLSGSAAPAPDPGPGFRTIALAD
jgi:hypothetical protein